MFKKILLIALFISPQCFAQHSNWQPVSDIDTLNGVVVRLHQELEAVKTVAREAESFDNQSDTNFDHKNFIKAIVILQIELERAIESERLR